MLNLMWKKTTTRKQMFVCTNLFSWWFFPTQTKTKNKKEKVKKRRKNFYHKYNIKTKSGKQKATNQQKQQNKLMKVKNYILLFYTFTYCRVSIWGAILKITCFRSIINSRFITVLACLKSTEEWKYSNHIFHL